MTAKTSEKLRDAYYGDLNDMPVLLDAANELDAAKAEIARLRTAHNDQTDHSIKLRERAEAAEAEIERLRKALKPFAEIVEGWSRGHLTGHVDGSDAVPVLACHILGAANALEGKS